jgi:hypothetical protein
MRPADHRTVETPSFTFKLKRVRDLRKRAEERAREDLANELRFGEDLSTGDQLDLGGSEVPHAAEGSPYTCGPRCDGS